MAVTIYDIAKKLGTTAATVSRGLRDDPSIADETREHIKTVANQIGYKPNTVARSLRMKRSACIGVIASGGSLQNYPIGLVEAIAVKDQYEVLIGMVRWGEHDIGEDLEIDRLLNRNVDGILLIPPALHLGRRELLEKLIEKKFPVVSVGAPLPPGADFVDWDRECAYRQLAAHLLKRGCQKLACFVSGMSLGVEARLKGVRQALEANNNGASMFIIGADQNYYDKSDIDGLMSIFLRHVAQVGWPDGVICHTDRHALAVLKAARINGVKVPEELAVTGCSDLEFSAHIEVPLTSIQVPFEEMIIHATKRLMNKISDPEVSKVQMKLILAAAPIIRTSSMYGTCNV